MDILGGGANVRTLNLILEGPRSRVLYSLFMSYRTRFSEVFSYIIEPRKKNMR